MTEGPRCGLCGDAYHEDPDTEAWMDLYCPGANAPEQDQQAFRSALAKTWAQVFDQEVKAFFDWEDSRPARNAAWDARARAEVSHDQLQADCVERTEAEVTRQKRDEVWQNFGEFEIDLPDHLTVKGTAPRPRLVQASSTPERGDPDDALLYVDPSQDVPGSLDER